MSRVPSRLPSLRLMVPLSLLGGFIVITAISLALSVSAHRAQLLADTHAQALRDVSLLARDAERFLGREPALLREDIALLMTNARLLAALLVDDRGNILHAHRTAWEGSPGAALLPADDQALLERARATRLALHEEHALPVRELDIALGFPLPARPEDLRSTARGVAYLSYDLSDADAEAVRAGLDERMLDLCALVIGTALLLWLVHRGVTAPLERLAAAATETGAGRFARVPRVATVREVDGLAASFNRMIDAIEERDRALQQHKESLEQAVEERTRELRSANRELESFSYSVSHDLRAPLRAIDGFSQALLEDCADRLGPADAATLGRIRAAAQKMGRLIDSLLALSRVTRRPLNREPLDLGALAQEVAAELQEQFAGRRIEFRIAAPLPARGDRELLRSLLHNLLGNACKYSAREAIAQVEFGHGNHAGREAFFVRDNGVGFDMQHAGRLFEAFQRVHADTEFEGTGIGLATVARIVARHGGEIGAESAPGQGATFWFTLPGEGEGVA